MSKRIIDSSTVRLQVTLCMYRISAEYLNKFCHKKYKYSNQNLVSNNSGSSPKSLGNSKVFKKDIQNYNSERIEPLDNST